MRTLATLVIMLGLAGPGFAGEVEIDASRSVFAVVTHKGGLAAGQAHNHLVVADGSKAELSFDPKAPLDAAFALEVAVTDLVVDDSEKQKTWYPRLEELGILDEPFGDVSEKDRAKIRKAMLSDKQLDAKAFPKIKARVTKVAEEPSTVGGVKMPYAVTLEIEVHGKKAEKQVAARFEKADGVLTIEAAGSFQFSDFGIKPYSAALGMVKNQDEFHVFLHLQAE